MVLFSNHNSFGTKTWFLMESNRKSFEITGKLLSLLQTVMFLIPLHPANSAVCPTHHAWLYSLLIPRPPVEELQRQNSFQLTLRNHQFLPTFFPVALSFEYIHISHQCCIHGCLDFSHAQHSPVAGSPGNSWTLLAAPRTPEHSVKCRNLSGCFQHYCFPKCNPSSLPLFLAVIKLYEN